jgi:hypothetical protein
MWVGALRADRGWSGGEAAAFMLSRQMIDPVAAYD